MLFSRAASSDDSFYSCCSGEQPECRTASTEAEDAKETGVECACGFDAHSKSDPLIPIVRPPGDLSSYGEALHISRAMCGRWVTMMDRSISLDEQYKAMGVPYFKRAVMNRLAVPLTVFLEKEDTVLHIHVHTPLGIRHMVCDITGSEFEDNDPDCGQWRGVASVVDYSTPWFCNGRPVRAIQQQRWSPILGRIIETRCMLPDAAQGRILVLNYRMYPKKEPGREIYVDRLLKQIE